MTRYLIFAGNEYTPGSKNSYPEVRGIESLLIETDHYDRDFLNILTISVNGMFTLIDGVPPDHIKPTWNGLRYFSWKEESKPIFDWFQIYDLVQRKIIIQRDKVKGNAILNLCR